MIRYEPVSAFRRTIIPRADHPISRRNLSGNAVRVLYRLRDNGFHGYLVGGCIRDLLLGREPKDFDVVTDATPSQVKKLFRNCRLVGRRFRLAHLHFREEIIEVATFRSALDDEDPPESGGGNSHPRILKDDDGMILRDNLFGTPEEDARRRDFTVNALCYNIADFSIIDHVGGLDDLNRGVIRTIGDPVVRFTEDPVRMIRAVRFAALLGFDIEPETWQALVELSPLAANAAPPRLYEEVLKLFLSGEGERCYQLMRQGGIFAALFPAFKAWLETETEGFPHVRLGRLLEVIDARVASQETFSPALLLSLMFGEYLEEQADRFRGEGLSPQEALDAAVAAFTTELAPTVQIPHKVVLGIRGILSCRHRFGSTPGRRPDSFIARPGFGEAFRYLVLSTDVTGEGKELCLWWERYLGNNPVAPAGASEEHPDVPGPRRKRRNRRRHRRAPAVHHPHQ
jgi:poly(A) polymerase